MKKQLIKNIWKRKTTRLVTMALMAAVMGTMVTGCGLLDDYYEDSYYDEDDNWGDEEGYYDDEEGYYEDDYSDEEGYYEDDSYEDGDYEDGDWGNEQGYDGYEDDYDSNGGSGNTSDSWAGFGKLGSASELNGTTVVVSVFADDARTSWSSSDSETIYNSLSYLGLACDWITKNAASYGCNAKFIYDWQQNEDLYYEAKINTNLAGDAMDQPTWEYIDSNIDSASLLSKYSADNIIYLILVNTPTSNTNTSCTRSYYEGIEYPYEVCYMYMFCDGEEEAPAAFAHEMLHTFGAPDLYMADEYNDNYGTTQEMVSYYEQTQSNDIMFTTYDAVTSRPYYDHISNDFTELDAYYVGLTDYSAEANEWNLEPSQH